MQRSLARTGIAHDVRKPGALAFIYAKNTTNVVLEGNGIIDLRSGNIRVPVLAEGSGITGAVIFHMPEGKLNLRLTPFAGGQRYTCEKLAFKDTNAWTFALSPSCNRYVGWRANILSDDTDAVALRAYALRSPMYVSRSEISVTVKEGESFGYASGPREGFTKRFKEMKIEEGANY